MSKFAALSLSCVLAASLAGAAHAEQLGSVDTAFKLIGPDHKIIVEAFDDPKVKGITCFTSRASGCGASTAGVFICALVILTVVVTLITRGITRPINRLTAIMLTLAARDLSVDLNLVAGVPDGVDADQRVIDFSAQGAEPYRVITGTGRSMTLDMPGSSGILVRAGGTMDVRLGNFFEFSGSMGLEHRAQTVSLSDGKQAQTDMLSLGGSDLSGFVGIGPYRSDVTGDGVVGAICHIPHKRMMKCGEMHSNLVGASSL